MRLRKRNQYFLLEEPLARAAGARTPAEALDLYGRPPVELREDIELLARHGCRPSTPRMKRAFGLDERLRRRIEQRLQAARQLSQPRQGSTVGPRLGLWRIVDQQKDTPRRMLLQSRRQQRASHHGDFLLVRGHENDEGPLGALIDLLECFERAWPVRSRAAQLSESRQLINKVAPDQKRGNDREDGLTRGRPRSMRCELRKPGMAELAQR